MDLREPANHHVVDHAEALHQIKALEDHAHAPTCLALTTPFASREFKRLAVIGLERGGAAVGPREAEDATQRE